jgi:hypothetical protein
VLIVSLPRSGSSWLGLTLGSAANASYLFEPINHSWLKTEQNDTLVQVPVTNPPLLYRQAAETVRDGLPKFAKHVVRLPQQWRLAERRRRRLVIKEVNPNASQYLLGLLRPRLIFLVRHPAAVAASLNDRGWWSPESIGWHGMGAQQGQILRTALDSIEHYADTRIVLYEDLCKNPLACFQDLFDFAGLTWDASMAARIEQDTSEHREGVYETRRHSQAMLRAWTKKLDAETVAQVRAGYAGFDLPWYQSDEDWLV